MNLNEEAEQIILRAIFNRGYESLPLDYFFLKKYNLMNIYFIGVRHSLKGCSMETYRKFLRDEIREHLKESNFPQMTSLYRQEGKEKIMPLLMNNENYYRTFKNLIRNELPK